MSMSRKRSSIDWWSNGGVATKSTKGIATKGTKSTKTKSTKIMKCAVVPLETERVGFAVIGAAIEVHRHLGAGFLERIYHEALCVELTERKLPFEREKSVTVLYKSVKIPGQRIDLIVEGCVIVELKAVANLHEIHEAKLISYLKTTGVRLGYLLNFHHTTMKEGIKRKREKTSSCSSTL